jgi:uncharacterized phage protein (TIGR01671 family)
MREIKFRAWSEDTGMDYGIGVTDKGNAHHLYDDKDSWIDKEQIVMQYTGLKDKNGKDIYEGDIIRYFADALPEKSQKAVLTNGPFANEPIHIEVIPWEAKFSDSEQGDFTEMIDEVVFEDGAFWSYCDGGLGNLAVVAKNAEIIGNIYENPELIKEENDTSTDN